MRTAAVPQQGKRSIKLGVAVLRQCQHNVAADFLKTCRPRPGQCLCGPFGGMGAPQPPQLGIAGALHAKADARHPCRAEAFQTFLHHHIGVGLQRDLRLRQRIRRRNQAFYLGRREQGRRPAAKVERIRAAVVLCKLSQQRTHIGLRHSPRTGSRVEITIPAFGPAVGNMQINSVQIRHFSPFIHGS